MTRSRWLVILSFAAALGCKRTPPPEPAPEGKKSDVVELSEAALANAQVEWHTITPGMYAPKLRVVASVVSDPQHLARIGARVAGRVTAVPVTLGQRVKKGQALLAVDTVELHQVTLEYLQAKARVQAASDAFARQQQLVSERVGAEADLKKAQSDSDSAQAALKEADEHLHFLGLGDSAIAGLESESTHGGARSSVPSPIDGRVVELRVSLGQVLSGNEDVVTVADVDKVWASLRFYERDLGSVHIGTPVDLRVTAFPDRPFPSTLSFLSDVVDPQSRSAEGRALLDNPDGSLRPGMSGTALVSLPAADPSQRMIPSEAVQPHDGGSIVFVVVGERRFQARPVRVGDPRGDVVSLIDGVSLTDEVVVKGAFALRGELERAALEE